MKILAALFTICLTAVSASANSPLIGIVTGHSSSGSNGVGDSYVQAVVKAGGVPVLIPTMFDKASAEAEVERVDALLFTGGEDVDPAWYGEEIAGARGINGVRDTSEIYMIRKAFELGVPILGICRGCQVINVALGGTLYQDIPSQIGAPVIHMQTESGGVATQTVYVDPDSRLAAILGVTTLSVNTLHHESVKFPAPGLRVVCRSQDGVVEGYEGEPGVDIIALQFHPEKLIQAGDDSFLSIFRDLTDRANNYRK